MSPSPAFTENFRAFEHTITRFTTSLPPLHQIGAALLDEKFTYLLVHSLAHAAMIRLHEPFADDQVSREVCLRAARSLIVVAKHIADADFDFLDPLIGHIWACAARVLVTEIAALQTAWPLTNTAELRGELATVLYAMTKLSARFPFSGYQAAKVQKLLDSI